MRIHLKNVRSHPDCKSLKADCAEWQIPVYNNGTEAKEGEKEEETTNEIPN